MRNVDRSPLFAALFPGPPGRVVVPATQFAAGDFPAICAMTGLPAETRRRFRFFRAPGWSFAFVFLICAGVGFLISGLLIFLVSDKVSGYLPLTSASARRLGLLMRVSVAIVGVALVMLIAAAFLATTGESLAQLASVLLVSTGLPVFLLGFTGLQFGLQVLKPVYGPTALVLPRDAMHPDRWIELRNVHPAFVAAVQQQHAARTAQGQSA